MKRILSYLRPFRFRMLVGFTIKVTGTMAELILPYILTYILEDVITELNVGKVIGYGGKTNVSFLFIRQKRCSTFCPV